MNSSVGQPNPGQPKSQPPITIVQSSTQAGHNQGILFTSSFNQPTLCINSLPSIISPLTSATIGNTQSLVSTRFTKSGNLNEMAQQQNTSSINSGNIISTTDGIFQYHGQNSLNIIQSNSENIPTATVFQDQSQALKSSIGIASQIQTQTIVLPEIPGSGVEQIQYALVAGDNNEGAYLVPASSLLAARVNVQSREASGDPENIFPKECTLKHNERTEALPLEEKMASQVHPSSHKENSSAINLNQQVTIGRRKRSQTNISLQHQVTQDNEVAYIVEADDSFPLTGVDLNSSSIISGNKLPDGSILEVISLDESGNICEIKSQEKALPEEISGSTNVSHLMKDEIIQKPIGKGPYFCEICRKQFKMVRSQ